jgi:hypothetical protein
MLQITEQHAGGELGIAVADAEHLLREMLGRLSSAHVDLDHGSAA